MSEKNLRVITSNKIISVNGSASNNTLNDYRTRYDSGTTFSISFGTISGLVALVAVLTEETSSVTMTVSYTGTNGTVTLPSVLENTTSTGTLSAGFGGGKYMAKYFSIPAGISGPLTVTFSKSVKVSRFIFGNYWSPVYNTNFGVQTGYQDLTSSERLQSGDIYTTVAPKFKTLQFDLQYMDESDKFKLFDIYRSLGKSKALFVSIFPEDSDKEKEQMYSIYGKLSSLSNISYVMFTMYSSTLQLEEI